MAQGIESTEFWKAKIDGFNNSFICNVCRLCANICDDSVPIFDKVNDKESIYSKLRKCLPSISVLENDIKPKQICLVCVSKLELCFSFIEMSIDADCKFEAALQTSTAPQIQLMDDNLLSKSIDFSWFQVKQESLWNDMKPETLLMAKTDRKMSEVELRNEVPNQIFQQRSYPQIVQVPTATSNHYPIQDESNLGVVLNKQDVNHNNILPDVIVSDSLSSQDLILLVELKCKDSASVLSMKKNDVPRQNITNKAAGLNNYQTKILDTCGNVRVVNVSDFDGKFNNNQSGKATSTFVNDNTNTASILKAMESDVLNGVIKLENWNGGSVTLNESLKTDSDTNYESSSIESTSNLDSLTTNSQQSITRDFKCTVCGKLFSRRNRLNAHLARHSSLRPHSCDKCDQRFITRWDLTLHLRIHSGVFSCEYCGKAFPAKGKLERHRRTHTGERPFPCDLCNKAFSEKRNLENHLKTHATAEARKVANSNALCSSCGRNLLSNIASALKSKCETCDKKECFSVFVDPNANTINQIKLDSSKCQNSLQNNYSNPSVPSNTTSIFLKTQG